MKRLQVWAILAAGVVAVSLIASGAQAQQRPLMAMGGASSAGTGIAVLDVSYIFKNHLRFKGEMGRMQADVEAAEAEVKKERDAIQAAGKELQDYTAGSADYKQRETALAHRQAELATRVNLQSDFLPREAKIYYTVYQEMMQEVDYYAQANGVGMVLRFNGDPVDQGKPEDVLRAINQPIIWYPKDRDITPVILEKLNGAARAAIRR